MGQHNDLIDRQTIRETIKAVYDSLDGLLGFNPDFYGGEGDGVKDDQPALNRTCAALIAAGSGTLYLPRGIWRCARQAGYNDGIAIPANVDAVIYFEPGSVLLMDNLHPSTGMGDRGHGIYKAGPGTIEVHNGYVMWADEPAARSYGDAYHLSGYPSDAQCIDRPKLLNCTAINTPQCGAVLMGCSDPVVKGFYPIDTLADGLHLNACRRPKATMVAGLRTGDDCCALVTYYDAAGAVTALAVGGPYALNALGEWSNAGGTISDVSSVGSGAHGLRVFGCLNTAIGIVSAKGGIAAVVVDSAIANGSTILWSGQASRGITIGTVTAIGCTEGIHAKTSNITIATDHERFWRFDVQWTNVSARDCVTDGALVEPLAGMRFATIRANCRIRFVGLREGSITDVEVDGADLYVTGAASPFATMAAIPAMGLRLDQLVARGRNGAGGTVFLQDLRDVDCGVIKSESAQGNGIYMERVTDFDATRFKVRYPNRGNAAGTRALLVAKCQDGTITQYSLHTDNIAVINMEFSGGTSPTENTRNVRVLNATYRNTFNQVDDDVVYQGGANAPTSTFYQMRFYNGGEASPVWRTFTNLD